MFPLGGGTVALGFEGHGGSPCLGSNVCAWGNMKLCETQKRGGGARTRMSETSRPRRKDTLYSDMLKPVSHYLCNHYVTVMSRASLNNKILGLHGVGNTLKWIHSHMMASSMLFLPNYARCIRP